VKPTNKEARASRATAVTSTVADSPTSISFKRRDVFSSAIFRRLVQPSDVVVVMSPRRPRVVSDVRPSIAVRPTDGRTRMSQSSLQGSGISRSVYNTVVRRIEKKGRERERKTDIQRERETEREMDDRRNASRA